MGGGVSKKKMAVNAFAAKMRNKGGVSLNKTEWRPSDGPNPDDVEVADVIACLTKFYKTHAPNKVKRVCGEVDQFIDNLGALFRSLQRTYGVMPRVQTRQPETNAAPVAAEAKQPDIGSTPQASAEAKSMDVERDSPKRGNQELEEKVAATSQAESPAVHKTHEETKEPEEPKAAAEQTDGRDEQTTPRREHTAEMDSPASSPESRKKRRSSLALVRRNTLANDEALMNFTEVRQPKHNVEERIQVLVDLAAELMSYVVPEETPDCTHSKTQNGDKITVWPNGTQYQKSQNGTTVLVFPNQRVIQKSQDKVIMKRPNGTLVQRSVVEVFNSKGGYIINQKNVDGLQSQFNAEGFREDFDGGAYLQVTNAAPETNSLDDFLADPLHLGRVEEHTAEYHLVLDRVNGRTVEIRTDGTQLKSFSKEGVFLIIYKNGLEIQHNRDGHTMQKSPDGTITQQNPDGSVIEAYFDGTKIHYKVDGSIVEEVPDEYIRITEADGTERMSHADMTFTVRRPDGTFFRYDETGKILEHIGKDGTDLLATKGPGGAGNMDSKEMKPMDKVASSAASKNSLSKPDKEMFGQTTNILNEILSTERTYITELEWIHTNFCKATPAGLDQTACEQMTPGVSEILEVSSQFLGDVNTAIEEYTSTEDHYDTLREVGATFVKHLSRFRPSYGINMRNYANAAKLASKFASEKLPTATQSLLLRLGNKLIVPVQRCMRYYMLLQQVLKLSKLRVTNENEEVKDIIKAYKAAKTFATFCNTEELQGQSQLLLNNAPKLAPHISGRKLMLQLDVCKASKNATPVVLSLYNNGVLVQQTLTGEVKAFDVCAPNTTIQQNTRSSRKPPSLEIVSCGLYPKATSKKSKRGWMLRESKRKMLSRDLQIRELDKLFHLMTQLVNNALLEASVKEMQVPAAHRTGYENIVKFKKLCEEDLAHGFISNKEYNRLVKRVVQDCEKKLAAGSKIFHIEIPIAVAAKDKDFELGPGDMDLTSNFAGDVEAAKNAVRKGRLAIPVAGAYIRANGKNGVYHKIVAAWSATL